MMSQQASRGARYDVFISYSHQDSDWVGNWLLPRLEAEGLRICIDFRDFEIGVPSIVNMENAVEQSRKTLLVLSPNWIQSEWTSYESLLVQTYDPSSVRRKTIPILLEPCELPLRLTMLTYADFTNPNLRSAQLPRLINALRDSTTSNASSLPTSTPSPNATATADAEHSHVTELLRIKRRRLEVLELQQARFGAAYVPPHIALEIEELRREIADLQA